MVVYCFYLRRYLQPKLQGDTFGDAETYLLPGVFGSIIIPIGLFMFGQHLPRTSY